jgi:hypothetical protein
MVPKFGWLRRKREKLKIQSLTLDLHHGLMFGGSGKK